MLDNKLSRLTMHGVIGNSTTINGRYIQCLEPFRYEITCFPLPRFPPFKATANYPRLRWAGLCAEMGHSGPLKFPYLCHARKETRDLMDLSHLSIGLLPAWWFFRLLAWWQWVLGRKYGNQISDKVVSQCACCGTLFFSVFTGEALTPSESTGIYRPSGLASAGSYVEEMPPKGDAPWNLRPRFAAPRSWELIGITQNIVRTVAVV